MDKFTTKFIESIPKPGRGQKVYLDELPPLAAVAGQLGLKAGKNTKTFFVQYRFEGQRRQLSIGKFPGRSLSEARKIAAEKLALVDKGIDPKFENVSTKTENKFKDLWDPYMEKVKRDDKKKKQAGKRPLSPRTKKEQYAAFHDRFIPEFGDMNIRDIKRHHIAQFLEETATNAPITANRLLSFLNVLFKRALNLGWIEYSPTTQMDKPSIEVPRSRALDRDEIKLIYSKLHLISRNQRDALKLLFLLPQRVGEVLAMRWEDIDFKEKVWDMSENKSDRAFSVPLSRQAVKILEDRKNGVGYTKRVAWMPTCEWIFPSRHNRYRAGSIMIGHTTTLKKSMDLFRKELDIPHWRIHDIRRTVRTLLAEIGIDENISELCLNHSVKGLVGVYNRYSFLDEKREALQKWADELEEITNVS